MKEIKIEARPENLNSVMEFIADELESADCPMKLQTQISIAVEEIFINIARYAYSPGTGTAVIRISTGEELTIEFEDTGKAFNPLTNDDPDISAGLDEREIGGLGIFMVKKIMDSVEYKRADNRNILLIKKKFA